MPLEIQARTVGEVSILACIGRIVEGDEAQALEQRIRQLLEKTVAEGRSTPRPKSRNDVAVIIDKPNAKSLAR